MIGDNKVKDSRGYAFLAKIGVEPFRTSRWCGTLSRILPGGAGRRR